jgi:hypothetical protein
MKLSPERVNSTRNDMIAGPSVLEQWNFGSSHFITRLPDEGVYVPVKVPPPVHFPAYRSWYSHLQVPETELSSEMVNVIVSRPLLSVSGYSSSLVAIYLSAPSFA